MCVSWCLSFRSFYGNSGVQQPSATKYACSLLSGNVRSSIEASTLLKLSYVALGVSNWSPVSGGVPREEVAQVTETMVRKMCLEAELGSRTNRESFERAHEAHQHNLCEYLSGGNKRKLSTVREPSASLMVSYK